MTLTLPGNVNLYLLAAGVLLGLLAVTLLQNVPTHSSSVSLAKAHVALLKPVGVLWH